MSKKRARPAKHEDVEEALLRWSMGARSVSHYEASNCLQKLRYFVVQRDGNSDLLDQIGKLEKRLIVLQSNIGIR